MRGRSPVYGFYEVQQRLHDLRLGAMVVGGVQEFLRGLAIAVRNRGEGLVFQPREQVGFVLRGRQVRQFLGGNSGRLHEGTQRHCRPGSPWPLAIRDDQIPVHQVVVVRTRRVAVANVEDLLEIVPVAFVAGDHVGSGHAREVVGALAQFVGQAMRLFAHPPAGFDGVLDFPAAPEEHRRDADQQQRQRGNAD